MTTERKIPLNIYKSGVVVDLSIGVWPAIAKLVPEELGLETVPEQIYLGHKRLMKPEYLKELHSLEYRANSWLTDEKRGRSFPFPIGQSRFVPFTALPIVLEKMQELEGLFRVAADEFVADYGPRRDEMLSHFSVVFDEMLEKLYPNGNGEKSARKAELMRKLEAKFPRADVLRGKFYFDFVVFNVSAAEFEALDIGTATVQANTAIETQQEYRQKISQKLDEFSESVINRLQAMVLDITGKLSERSKAGKINMQTIKSFRSWVARFRELNFVGLDVGSALDDLEHKLNETEKGQFTNEEFRLALEKDIQTIQETATKSDVSTVLHKYRRRIETN